MQPPGAVCSTMEPDSRDMIRDRRKRLIWGVARLYGRLNMPQRLFLPLFLFAGLVFVFAVPPFQNPDEPMHFYRGYQVAQGHVFSTADDVELYGGDIPASMRELVLKSEIEHQYDYGYRFFLNYDELMSYGYGGEKVFEGFPNTAIYSPLAYLPSALAHGIVGLFDGPLLVALYLARLLSLVATLFAFMAALRIIPFGKWIVFAVGLVPMALVLILAPAYYANGDYKTPSQASIGSMALNIGLNAAFVGWFGMGAASIALATSISAWLNYVWLKVKISEQIGQTRFSGLIG